MYQPKPRHRLIPVLLAAVVVQPLSGMGADDPEQTRLKEQWGQLLFCKRIYTMPEVRPRLYSFDTEACNKAERVIFNVLGKYSEAEQGRLKDQAEKHAVKLSYNTFEPYHSVPACREYCSELADSQEEQDD